MVADRQRAAARYDEALEGMKKLSTVVVPAGGVCNYYKYIAIMKQKIDRKSLKADLRGTYGVSLAGEVYEEPVQRQPIFERYAEYPLPA